MAVAARHSLRETVHAAFGQASLLGEVTHALGGDCRKDS